MGKRETLSVSQSVAVGIIRVSTHSDHPFEVSVQRSSHSDGGISQNITSQLTQSDLSELRQCGCLSLREQFGFEGVKGLSDCRGNPHPFGPLLDFAGFHDLEMYVFQFFCDAAAAL